MIVVVSRAAVLLVAFAVIAACSNQPPPQPLPQIPGVTAVYDTLGKLSHTVTVMTINGDSAEVVARLGFRRRAALPVPLSLASVSLTDELGGCGPMACPPPLDPPYVSTSKDRIYVLDGDSTIKEIGLGGALRTVMSLSVPANQRAAFAVSPDNREVAVAMFDFGTTRTASESLFVQPLGGGQRLNLTSSLSRSPTPDSLPIARYYWPIGWRDGKVVLAVGSPYTYDTWNPYSAVGYALLGPTVGAAPTLISPQDCVPIGLISSAGTACADVGVSRCWGPVATAGFDSCYWKLDWTGHQTVFSLPHIKQAVPIFGGAAALSPDGQAIITDRLFLATPTGGRISCCNQLDNHAQADPDSDRDVGWIDDSHVTWSYLNRDGTYGQGLIALGPGYSNAQNIVIQRPNLLGHLVATLPGAP